MTEGLLKTKLFAPPPRRNLVSRPRLREKLAEAFYPEIRLTLVSALPGFGKTTVVSEWLSSPRQSHPTDTNQPGMKSAWLTLDETDHDPIRFWRYFSPNTLKAHAQNIYSKLSTHNRIEAVNKARELRLL